MSGLYLTKGLYPEDFLRKTVEFIRDTQLPCGSVPWFEGSYADPWDHVEAAMGLSIGGEFEHAVNAYRWLKNIQLEDGSWWAAYKNGEIHNHERRETNFVAYIATGIWHHFLISDDREFLVEMYPMVEQAITFVLALQTEHGDIHWAVDAEGKAKEDALVTGNSSIYKSLECAFNISVTLGENRTDWFAARSKLGNTLANHPERFDRTWESKARYSMDWFYPVLTGALDQQASKQRLAERWDEFVMDGMGCRCVSDEPWVTIAESCELTMALLAAGEREKATEVYSWLHQWRLEDGSYWTGYQFKQDLLWPDEKPTWTAGAILLAADALTDHTPAAYLFKEVRLLELESDLLSAEQA
ncbi:hypothetical protein SIN8267_02969 [Sinobacterium norvegicum]|uniref:Prenyltransferase n=1 Tax=Sinobacterium norvegicum TaxID=1641715 RepID=A0ABN8EN55_9GAMM|nr:prenyltransferase [Sinobacterium norvegicum]CAH0992832.1 hypothetical protein SIN8267_02969 [Sinobacterium norvegicum]